MTVTAGGTVGTTALTGTEAPTVLPMITFATSLYHCKNNVKLVCPPESLRESYFEIYW